MINSFIAFNVNAFNFLLFDLMSNWLLVVMIICAIATTVMLLKEELEDNVIEEQNIL